MGNKWSENELNILKKYYGKISKQEILRMLPLRTYAAMQTKANLINVSKRKNEYKVFGDFSIIYIYKNEIKYECIIDTEDLEKVLTRKWHLRFNKHNSSFYVDGRPSIRLHRFIMDCPPDMMIDHMNHNTLDNRKCNLRIVNNSENMRNRKGVTKLNLTGFLGVGYRKDLGRYRARITVNKKPIALGTYNNINDAIEARKKAEQKYFRTSTPNGQVDRQSGYMPC